MTAWPYWPRPPVWRTNLPSIFSTGRPKRLAVGDLRPADVRVDRELAHQAVDDDLEVELAHAGDQGLAGLVVGADAERRVLLGRGAAGPAPSLSWSAFVFGSIATAITGSGKSIDSSLIGAVSIASVSPVVVFLRPTTGGDLARADLLALLAVVRVHLQDAADALGLAGRRVQDAVAGLDLARVDAEVRQLADVRVGHDLEDERRERLVERRAARELVLGARVDPVDRRHVERARQVVDDARRAAAGCPCS